MKEVVDWAVENIGPNVLKYTSDSSEMQQLLRSGAADAVGFWNSLARLEFFNGYTDTALLLPKSIYPANGYLWIPKGAPHPVLAQIFINWRLSPDVQFPNTWPIDHGPWSELSEGFLGPEYVTHVPEWFAKDYFTYFPTLDQIKTQFKTVDWNAYNASQKEWQDYYAQKIGQ
jgi:spermidine/putrescine-binding protein